MVPLPKGRFAGIRIIPRMRADSVKIDVSALARGEKNLSGATDREARLWKGEAVGSYAGNRGSSVLLSGLHRLGLPVFAVEVVQGRGPPPGPGSPADTFGYAGCACNFPQPRSGTFGGILASGVGGISSSPEAGKCVQVTGCGQCCRMAAP
jgi:hypothetical protein